MRNFSPVLLRIGMAAVILWFAYQQLSDVQTWISYLPDWTNSLPMSQTALVYLNGWFELTFGLMLLFGFYTRFVALLLGLHLLEIAYTVGYNGVGVRDTGLAVATLSASLYGTSDWSLDNYFAKKELATRPLAR